MTSSLQRVKNPTGRMDWLAANLLKRAVENSSNPLLKAVYAEVGPQLEGLIVKNLGPKNKTMRRIRYAVRTADNIQRRMRKQR